MKITLLADFEEAAPTVAGWYFNEWGGESVENITRQLLLGTNRNKLPILYLAQMEGALVGSGEIKQRKVDKFPDFHYWLDGIYVQPDYRGKGISTALIEFGLSEAKALGLGHLHLRSTDYNVPLYIKYGFRIVAEDDDKFIMELPLDTWQPNSTAN